jgi:hypothetical protein
MASYNYGRLRHFYLDPSRRMVGAANIVWGVTARTDIENGPDGALWYIDGGGWMTGTLKRIVGPGLTPVPTYTPDPVRTITPGPRCPGQRFVDVCPGDYFYPAVVYLAAQGVVSGYEDESFRPYNNTTRGQLTKIIVLAEQLPVNINGGPHFSDVGYTHSFYRWIESARYHGLVSGYADGTFRPESEVTRGQLCKILVIAEGWEIDTGGGPHFTDVPADDPFYRWIETAYNRGIISGYEDGTFRPGTSATRGQISKIVYNAVTSP